MKEIIEKLNKRLKEKLLEYINKANDEMIENGHTFDFENFLGHKEAYENVLYDIVKELAEEYKGRTVIDGQYCWQICGATEHCKECNRLGNGTIDYFENYDCLVEEYKGDLCEWKFTKSVVNGGYFYSSGCNHKRFSDLHNFEFCPYCGKKIKVATYTEGE